MNLEPRIANTATMMVNSTDSSKVPVAPPRKVPRLVNEAEFEMSP